MFIVQADNDLRRFLAARSLLTPQVLLSWRFLTIPENCWRFLTIPDNCWQLLTIPYNSWQLLQLDHLHRRTIRTRAQASNKLPRKNIFSDEGGNISMHCVDDDHLVMRRSGMMMMTIIFSRQRGGVWWWWQLFRIYGSVEALEGDDSETRRNRRFRIESEEFDFVKFICYRVFFLTGTPPKSSKYKKVNLG